MRCWVREAGRAEREYTAPNTRCSGDQVVALTESETIRAGLSLKSRRGAGGRRVDKGAPLLPRLVMRALGIWKKDAR